MAHTSFVSGVRINKNDSSADWFCWKTALLLYMAAKGWFLAGVRESNPVDSQNFNSICMVAKIH